MTGRHLPPRPELLGASGHNLFRTSAGDLDALGTVGQGLGFEDLLPRAVTFQLGEDRIRTISLELLIELKEQAGRPKDLAVLPVLRRTLEMTRGNGTGAGED